MGKRGVLFVTLILLLGGLLLPGLSQAGAGGGVAARPDAVAPTAGGQPESWVWHFETVASTGIVGEYASLVWYNNLPRIAYYDRTNGDLRYAYYNGTTWTFETIDSTGDVGQYAALTIDPGGTARVSYYDATNTALKYSYRSVTGWSTPVAVDSTGDVGRSTAITWQPSTYSPYICYYDVTNTALKYAYYDISGWHVAVVDGTVGGDTDCAIAMDAAGNPHISYYFYNGGTGQGDLKYAKWAGVDWLVTTVEAGGGAMLRVGLYSSILVDPSGYPHISYQRLLPTPSRVRYAYMDAGGWHLSTVASGNTPGHTSLARDSQGHLHLAYVNYSTQVLYYAYNKGAGWVIQAVEEADDYFASLQVNPVGHPRIAYALQTGSDYDLRYTYACIWAQAAHSPEPACVNTPVDFTNATTGTLPITYLWDFGDGITTTVGSPTHIYTAPGVYTATLTGTNSCGADTIVQTVVISSTPEAGFTYTPTQICAGTVVQFVNTTVGSATLSFIWDFGDGQSSYEPNPTHVFDQPGNYQVTLLATNNCGVDVAQASLSVHGAPTNLEVAWSPSPPEVGHVVTFTASANSTLPVTYTWDLGDGHPGQGAVVAHVYTDTGDYTVTLTATNDCGASVTTAVVNVVCYPVTGTNFTWQPPDPVRGEVISFTAAATGTTPLVYAWAFGDGGTGQGAMPTHTYAAGGDYTATLTVTNFCGAQVVPRSLHICGPVEFPAFSWSPPDPMRGDLVTFTAQVSGTAPLTYSWAFGDGGTGQGAVTTYTYAAGGTYPVVLTATNPCGVVSVTQPIAICGPVMVDSLTWDPLTPTVGFPVEFTVALTGTEPLTCTWAFGDGTGSGPGSCAASVAHAYTRTGSFTAALTAENACGLDTASGAVVVVALPNAAFTSNAPVCYAETVVFTNTSGGVEPLVFGWAFGDGYTSTLRNPTHDYDTGGLFTVTLTATNPYGQDTASGPVLVVAGVSAADFTWLPANPAPGQVVTLTATTNGTEPVTYEWALGDGYTDTGRVVTHAYATTATYTVTLQAANDCGAASAAHVLPVSFCTAPTGLAVAHRPPAPLVGEVVYFTLTLAGGSEPLTWAVDFGDGSAYGYGPLVTHTYTATGTYTVAAAAWNACGYAGPVELALPVTPLVTRVYLPLVLRHFCAGDAYEPDNTPVQAKLLVLGDGQRHNFQPQGDVDWLRLSLTAGGAYHFETSALAGGADTRLYLYQPPDYNTPVAENDDCGQEKWSCFDYTPTASGVYYLKVDQYPGGAGWGCDVQYTVTATQSP